MGTPSYEQITTGLTNGTYIRITDIPKPLAYQNLKTKDIWFVATRPKNKDTVWGQFIVLLDLNKKQLVYDCRDNHDNFTLPKFLDVVRKKSEKPSLADLEDTTKYKLLDVTDFPEVYRRKTDGNFYFYDGKHVLDRYIALWDKNGELAWDMRDSALKRFVNNTKKIAKDVAENPLLLALLKSSVPAQVIEIILKLSRVEKEEDVIPMFGSDRLKEIFELYKASKGQIPMRKMYSAIKYLQTSGKVNSADEVLAIIDDLAKHYDDDQKISESELLSVMKNHFTDQGVLSEILEELSKILEKEDAATKEMMELLRIIIFRGEGNI